MSNLTKEAYELIQIKEEVKQLRLAGSMVNAQLHDLKTLLDEDEIDEAKELLDQLLS